MPFGESFTIVQGVFLKSLGLIYLIAFSSLLPQVKGLFGKKGIEPIYQKIEEFRLFSKPPYWMRHPSLFWFFHSDNALISICWIGILASLGAIVGIFTAGCLIITWIAYLSFVNFGSPFLNFQWDVLLLETGFIAIFYALLSPAPPIFIWVFWLLLFRFMFASGLVKWVYGSKEWRDFSALEYHYETQPLPTRLAYYLHHQPNWFAKFSVWATYFVEIFIPLLIFTPREIRVYPFALLAGFQLILIATGNFAFFNWLTILLCVPLLADTQIAFLKSLATFTPLLPLNSFTWALLYMIGSIFFLINGIALVHNLYPLKTLNQLLDPLHPIYTGNTYGLFIHMTTERFEISIEGSMDGKNWKEYPFCYKPGPLQRPPSLVAPHQPRLDWQMWFASLSSYRQNPWFSRFIFCLFEQSPDVLKLLKNNPFPDHPPQYIRCHLYRYMFSPIKNKRETGCWWRRELVGAYSPIYSLEFRKKIE